VIRQGFSRLSSISLLYTLFAVVFSLLITVGAHPVAAAEGDLDTNFDSDGKVTTAIGGSNHRVRSVAIQSDGKIVAAGNSRNGNWDFALARYNTDGSLDTSFDSGGKVTTDFGGGNDRAYSVAIQSDGKIVAAGYSSNGSNNDFALARYNTDGTLDTNFDSGGKVTTDFGGGNDYAFSVAIQSDGKIVAAGRGSNGGDDFALVRYNTDGTLDTNFDSGGKVTTDFGGDDDQAYSVAIQSDGKIVVAGLSYTGSNNGFALVRYNTDGTLDTSFDSDGKVTTAIGGTNDRAYSVAIQSDGKIVAAGYSYSGISQDFALVRYLGITSPATPSAPTATIGNGQATVTWTKPADNGSTITGYTVTSSGGQTCTTNDADTLTCVVTGLTNGTAYTFTVTATNGGGASAASVASSSVTPAPAPTPVPTLPLFGLGILVSLLGLFGLRKLRQ
jgi:uncharacterized delta-60 repeat protein